MSPSGVDDPRLREQLGASLFRQRWPWIGGDLQTLRDTLRPVDLPLDQGTPIHIRVPALPSGAAEAGELLAYLDKPLEPVEASPAPPKALVVLLHGLGGSSRRLGVRRMGLSLQRAGYAVLRLNLRGADPGRHLAGGTYAAECNSDLLPVLEMARSLAMQLAGSDSTESSLPLYGAGFSLGGTMLLNACLESTGVLDRLFCASSPLDLAMCSASIERPRNRIYQRWLLQRLVRQTLADPWGASEREQQLLMQQPLSIRAFDAAVTAPRWGYASVDDYYATASPMPRLLDPSRQLPPTLILQAFDDPWVPASTAIQLRHELANQGSDDCLLPYKVLITARGGHNGFHGTGESLVNGCWSDRLACNWFDQNHQSSEIQI